MSNDRYGYGSECASNMLTPVSEGWVAETDKQGNTVYVNKGSLYSVLVTKYGDETSYSLAYEHEKVQAWFGAAAELSDAGMRVRSACGVMVAALCPHVLEYMQEVAISATVADVRYRRSASKSLGAELAALLLSEQRAYMPASEVLGMFSQHCVGDDFACRLLDLMDMRFTGNKPPKAGVEYRTTSAALEVIIRTYGLSDGDFAPWGLALGKEIVDGESRTCLVRKDNPVLG